MRMRSSLFYDSPPLFQFTVLSGFARLRIKEVRISEVLLQLQTLGTQQVQVQ